jgi:ABC-type transport system involved in multi-copper enzyme maturation permease subunit
MLRIVLKREILHNLYSLRFAVSMALVLAVFIAGSLSFVRNQETALDKYRETQAGFLDDMKKNAAENATILAVTQRTYDLRPRDNSFIADAKEKYLPNAVAFSAWNVFSFQNRSGSANPFLIKFDELSWAFIAVLIVSFIVLLFTFDAVSGEKESKTLALTLSNSVSRAALLLGKYLSAVVSVLLLLVPAVLISLLIVLLAGRTPFTASLVGETAGFLAVSGLFAATMAAFGLLSSVFVRNSNVSLLLALSFWLLFAVVVPNSSSFLAKKMYPIERSEAVQHKVNAAFDDLNKNAPPGSWMMNPGNPFLPQHELRANLQMKILVSEKQIRDAYYQSMFSQFEKTRLLTAASPMLSFEYLIEALVGGGYPRFRKAWDNLHVYQGQFLAFFKNLDAQDPKSPHWYNPNGTVSTTRLPVAFETVPQFSERSMTFADRAKPAAVYLVILILMTGIVYLLSYFLFVRYDVR